MQNPNEIIFEKDEFSFDIEINNSIMKLIISNEIYIETENDIFWYDDKIRSFVNEDGINLVLSENNKKIIEDAFNIAKI